MFPLHKYLYLCRNFSLNDLVWHGVFLPDAIAHKLAVQAYIHFIFIVLHQAEVWCEILAQRWFIWQPFHTFTFGFL